VAWPGLVFGEDIPSIELNVTTAARGKVVEVLIIARIGR
jgi:hypothetical protein